MATNTTTTGAQPALTADEMFEKFYDLDCTETCEGDYEWDCNAWTCDVHRPNPNDVYALFHDNIQRARA